MSHGPGSEHPVAAMMKHLAHLLPAQGPIGVFIHQNTLHAFQHLPFERAVCDAARLYGAEPFMPESAYRDALANGRIRMDDVDAILSAEPDSELWPGGWKVSALHRAMLVPGLRDFRPETIQWELADGGLRDRFRPDLPLSAREALAFDSPAELFGFCEANAVVEDEAGAPPARPRDGVLAASGRDMDELVHPLLIKLTSSFLDQGLAYWPMPEREKGLWYACREILGHSFAVEAAGLRRLPEFVRRSRSWDSLEAVVELLRILGVDDGEREAVLQAELLALPGWAGLIRQLEADPALAPHESVPASLMDFAAVRLLLTAAATASAMGEPDDWRYSATSEADPEARRLAVAALYFDALQLAGLSTRLLASLAPSDFRKLFQAIASFGNWERRRVLHLAYERRHERQILLPIDQHRADLPAGPTQRPAVQAMFCIDEREESIRRHLEETDPQTETLGVAGFFGVAMNYKGIDDAHGVSFCPVVVKPRHSVEERPLDNHGGTFDRRVAMRRLWARTVWQWFVSSRTLMRGWMGTTVLGLLSVFPLAGRVLSPRRHAQLVNWFQYNVLPEPQTELAFLRAEEESPAADGALLKGFTIGEMADRVGSTLAAAGLKAGMARLVVILGHGSTSLNNPHESAHDCGACGGRRGASNARVFAAMANRPDVRSQLPERGVVIPDDTWFVGGYHDTCNDDVDLSDLNAVPATHTADVARAKASLDRARALSAHERARRFEAAPWGINAAAGLHHVQERAEHLAEPRPEYGHCTNAVCIVGPRSTTRGLFFDRRAFLVSYDATQDPGDRYLAALLGAVIPVCGGISLEYYFSFVDNEGYGCGTKLPHNVTGLVGVMNGSESDLRTGLPWQMVEIHEPVRILFVVETSPERVLETIRKSPLLWEFLSNRWIRLAAMDPAGGPIVAYRDGVWEPVQGDDEGLPSAATSAAWYEGRREHLPVARIAMPRNAGTRIDDKEELAAV